MSSLLERAKALPLSKGAKKTFSREEVELALAYMHGDIPPRAITKVLGHLTRQNTHDWALRAVRWGIRQNLIDAKMR